MITIDFRHEHELGKLRLAPSDVVARSQICKSIWPAFVSWSFYAIDGGEWKVFTVIQPEMPAEFNKVLYSIL